MSQYTECTGSPGYLSDPSPRRRPGYPPDASPDRSSAGSTRATARTSLARDPGRAAQRLVHSLAHCLLRDSLRLRESHGPVTSWDCRGNKLDAGGRHVTEASHRYGRFQPLVVQHHLSEGASWRSSPAARRRVSHRGLVSDGSPA